MSFYYQYPSQGTHSVVHTVHKYNELNTLTENTSWHHCNRLKWHTVMSKHSLMVTERLVSAQWLWAMGSIVISINTDTVNVFFIICITKTQQWWFSQYQPFILMKSNQFCKLLQVKNTDKQVNIQKWSYTDTSINMQWWAKKVNEDTILISNENLNVH